MTKPAERGSTRTRSRRVIRRLVFCGLIGMLLALSTQLVEPPLSRDPRTHLANDRILVGETRLVPAVHGVAPEPIQHDWPARHFPLDGLDRPTHHPGWVLLYLAPLVLVLCRPSKSAEHCGRTPGHSVNSYNWVRLVAPTGR